MSFAGSKFGRRCKLTMELANTQLQAGEVIGQTLTIPEGLTIEFRISRQCLASTQTAEFRVYNLGPADRDAIFKDQFDWTQFRAIQFFAGYDGFMPQIFNGTIFSAYSEKHKEDVVTIINAFDGGFPMTNGWTNAPSNAGGLNGQTASDVINQLATPGSGFMPGLLGPPVVGNFPVTNLRGEVLFGNTWGLIRQKSGGNCTISDGIVYALNPNEGLASGEIQDITTIVSANPNIPVISSDTGLLGAPRRSGVMVEWDMLFEPRITLFQIVYIQSTFNPRFNGTYKVMGFEHRGTVSPAVLGDYETTARFLFGNGNVFSATVNALAG
jgi:hypothetical protein